MLLHYGRGTERIPGGVSEGGRRAGAEWIALSEITRRTSEKGRRPHVFRPLPIKPAQRCREGEFTRIRLIRILIAGRKGSGHRRAPGFDRLRERGVHHPCRG